MLRHALKCVAAAALLLAPTLTMVASAPQAFADWSYPFGTCYTSCTYKGLAEGHIGWSNGAAKDISMSIDTVNPTATPTDQTDWTGTAGGSVTVRVQWTNTGTPPSPAITDWTRIDIQCWHGCPNTYTPITHYFTSTEMANQLAFISVPLNANLSGGGAAYLGDMNLGFQILSPDPNLDGSGLYFDEYCGCVTSYGPGTQAANSALGSDMILRGTGAILGQSDNTVSTNESTIGSTFRFGAIRTYQTTWARPSSTELGYMSSGHRILIFSNRPPTATGCSNGYPRWSLVTDANCDGVVDHTNDALLDNALRDLQSAAATGNTQAIYTMFHEPNHLLDGSGCIPVSMTGQDPTKTCAGTATDYANAWQRVRDHVSGTNGATAACGTAPNYGQVCDRVLLSYTEVPSNMVGTDTLRPADNIVDLYTPDPYTYFCYYDGSTSCDSSAKYRSFQTIVSNTGGDGHGWDIVSIAKAHNKQMLFGEVGAHPGCPNGSSDPGCGPPDSTVSGTGVGTTRSQWFSDMASYLSTNTDAKQWIIGFAYYVAGTHDWKFVNYGTNNYHGLSSYETNMVSASYFLKGSTTATQGPAWIPQNH